MVSFLYRILDAAVLRWVLMANSLKEPENEYQVLKLGSLVTYPPPFDVPTTVTLRSRDLSVPLPSPIFFDVHARVGRILDVTGIGLKISRALSPLEIDDACVAADGSTDLGSIVSRKLLVGIWAVYNTNALLFALIDMFTILLNLESSLV